jgi:nicotinamide mononucleotide adenylyltransferase
MTEGSVHGRFQPFHNEHLDYVLRAQKLCDYLWVGITKYDITSTDSNPLGRLRERPESNPLTFFERVAIIGQALVEGGLDRSEFGFVPFPSETPHRLPDFMPTSIRCYTTICEPWNLEKIEVLRAIGYEVSVLYERTEKGISGGTIRKDIAAGGNSWKSMVPLATIEAVERLNLRGRLLKLIQADPTSVSLPLGPDSIDPVQGSS